MEEKQRKRIIEMEQIMTEIDAEVNNITTNLADFERLFPKYEKLLEYYSSSEWRKDFEESNKSDFPSPKEFPHGVLSEDGLYNQINNIQELGLQLIKVGTKMLETK